MGKLLSLWTTCIAQDIVHPSVYLYFAVSAIDLTVRLIVALVSLWVLWPLVKCVLSVCCQLCLLLGRMEYTLRKLMWLIVCDVIWLEPYRAVAGAAECDPS